VPNSTAWYYYANTQNDTMKDGINLYNIKFYGADNTLLYTQLFTIVKESKMQFLVKRNNKSGATMLELTIMMAIMSLWITSVLSVMMSTWDFAKDTEDSIQATNLAREWIEWIINWRNTNWLRFSSDKKNCWIVRDYNSSCIGGGNPTTTISSGSYFLYEKNGAWFLSWSISLNNDWSNWNTYKQAYRVFLWMMDFLHKQE